MIAIDTNLLVYSVRSDMSFHSAALACIRQLTEGVEPWAVPWPCAHEFIGAVTNPRIFPVPMPLERALQAVESWMRSPRFGFIGEATGHWQSLRAVAVAGRVVGPLIHDAKIAAICIEHGVRELWSADRDFSRFPQLKVINPLARS